MTNNQYPPLDTRAPNALFGAVWFVWTLVKWFFILWTPLLPLSIVYFAFQEAPTGSTIFFGVIAIICIMLFVPRRRPRNA